MSKRRVRPQVSVSVFVVSLAGPAKIVRVWPVGRAWKAVRRHTAEWCSVNDNGDAMFLDVAPAAPDRPWFGILLHRDPGGFTPEAYHRHAILWGYPERGDGLGVREAREAIRQALRDIQPGAVSFHDRTGRR